MTLVPPALPFGGVVGGGWWLLLADVQFQNIGFVFVSV
jgi:hypothetical protein